MLKIAIQRSGRLYEDSIKLLKECGIELNNGNKQLKSVAYNFPLEVYFFRDDDIPQYVQDGVADIGIVGENVLMEKEKDIELLYRLGFGRCRLSVAVPKSMAYRSVKDLNGLTEGSFLQKVEENFLLEKTSEAFSPLQPHTFGMYMSHQWYKLSAKTNTYSEDPIANLDITILHENLLQPVLGIADQRTDKRIDFIGGIRGLGELEKRVDSGDMAVAFSIHPVTIQQLFDVADSGNVMPPKSTWFEPKLRDGLLTHLVC